MEKAVQIVTLLSVVIAGALGNSHDLRDELNKLQESLKQIDVSQGCEQRPADIIFVLDESTSIWPPHFILQLEFVTKVIDIFDLSPGMTHIGVMNFADRPRIEFQLGMYGGDEEAMKRKIVSIDQGFGGTKTYLALDMLRRHMFAPNKIRQNVPQIAIVITDGESDNPERTAAEAALLHEQGIHVFAIGVGHNILRSELLAIASSPEDVFMVDNYGVLDRLKDAVAWKACQVATTPAPPQLITNCNGNSPLDVLFSLPDDAGIIDTELSLLFIEQVTEDLKLGPTGVQVGMTPRFCEQGQEIHLREHDNKVTFGQALQSRQLTSIPTHSQVEYLYDEGFQAKNGGREGAVPCGVLIVDNKSRDMTETMRHVEEARRQGITLLVIGVGEYVEDGELESIAGSEDNWWHIETFDQLGSLKQQVITRLCQVAARAPTPPPPQLITNCDGHNPVDVLFSIPDDAGINSTQRALSLVEQVTSNLQIGPTGVQVGLTPRYCELAQGVTLKEHDNKVMLGHAINRRQLDSLPIHLQIEYIHGAGYLPQNGGREGAVSCAVLIVDNKSEDMRETMNQVEYARRQGITLLVIGVGEYVEDQELQRIAGSDNNWWHVDTYDQLGSLEQHLITRLCQVMERGG